MHFLLELECILSYKHIGPPFSFTPVLSNWLSLDIYFIQNSVYIQASHFPEAGPVVKNPPAKQET